MDTQDYYTQIDHCIHIFVIECTKFSVVPDEIPRIVCDFAFSLTVPSYTVFVT